MRKLLIIYRVYHPRISAHMTGIVSLQFFWHKLSRGEPFIAFKVGFYLVQTLQSGKKEAITNGGGIRKLKLSVKKKLFGMSRQNIISCGRPPLVFVLIENRIWNTIKKHVVIDVLGA